ncbi:MAG: hypothetical protein HYT82_02470 [Candidatus Harrisonbacteria bacterium]|nr:hypothetical protein [Candidatus Harrisonbacteria bacterium]MBI2406029.1 hypothetical protein [Candidatus Harrisonbacteria bacterium]
MSKEKDVVCAACQKRVEGATALDKPVRRPAVRCQHGVKTHYPGFAVVWCVSCALAHNECALCGEPLPKQ